MEKKKLVVIFLIILILIILGIVIFKFFNFRDSRDKIAEPVPARVETRVGGRDAFDIAMIQAKQWQDDAKLSYIKSGEIDAVSGLANKWDLLFVSDSVKNKAFSIQVAEKKIILAEEIDYFGKGADFPEKMISQQEAIAKVKKMPGYEDVAISSVEAVYGRAEKVWYWGVTTSKGTVSVEAK